MPATSTELNEIDVTVFPGIPGKILIDACKYKGISLDRLTTVGPLGGTQILWCDAAKRDHPVVLWSWRKKDAVSS